MVNTQARAFPWEKLPIPRSARRQASCTTSSESARLPVSQRTNLYASSRWGSTTLLKRALASPELIRLAAVSCCGADEIAARVRQTAMEFMGGIQQRLLGTRSVFSQTHVYLQWTVNAFLLECRCPRIAS